MSTEKTREEKLAVIEDFYNSIIKKIKDDKKVPSRYPFVTHSFYNKAILFAEDMINEAYVENGFPPKYPRSLWFKFKKFLV